MIGAGRLLDQGIHPNRPIGQSSDQAEPFAEIMAVDIGQGDGLNDADPSRGGHCGDQLRVAAGVHRAADERHLDAGLVGERGVEAATIRRIRAHPGLSRHRTLILATASPD